MNLLRCAAMAKFGAVGGGVFLAGGAIAAKVAAQSELGKAAVDVVTGLASGVTADLLGAGFRDENDSDLQTSMHAAVQQALQALRREADPEFRDWFQAWQDNLAVRKPEEVFRGTGDADPMLLELGEAEFRAHWWAQMEPTLVRWRHDAETSVQRLNLDTRERLPAGFGAFLAARLPEALREAHDIVLRKQELTGSWIAFQQQVFRSHGQKLDELLDLAKGKRAAEKVWDFPRPTRHFRERPDLMRKIDAALAAGHTTALTAMHGLGGIGKSQLARHFAAERMEQYRCGAWINAETPTAMLASFEQFARQLGIAVEKDPLHTAAAVRNALVGLQPWLLIFDNAESPQFVREQIERLHGGHVLITSRSRHWEGLATPVEVSKWTEAEAVAYLLERTGQADACSGAGVGPRFGWLGARAGTRGGLYGRRPGVVC